MQVFRRGEEPSLQEQLQGGRMPEAQGKAEGDAGWPGRGQTKQGLWVAVKGFGFSMGYEALK